ncbi:MAG TPA: APC family permease [Candidatus Limnocylindrales bacterium]|jgi:amino acid transporter|nr:APC family permease [Candidatus Limnocylindrales bacterium]
MIGGRRPISGRKPGDKRVRVERYHAPYFRYTGPNQLTAKAAASAPTTGMGRFIMRTKAILLGKPLANEEEIGERLSKKKALAIFSSDAISSSAYATEEILLAFLLAGVGGAAFLYSIEVSIAIAVLLAIVAFSYRQVCYAYPTGGGSYSVSKANIGRLASLVAAAALLVDYTLTVAVSTSSAVEQIASAVPALDPVRVEIGIAAIGLITLGNLRGLREAGNIFAIPTYLFLASAFIMIAAGTFRILFQGDTGPPPTAEVVEAMKGTAEGVTILILLRAFASGAVALTGTEAIATGVPAFQPPESRNAARTLMVMAAILGTLFVGITFLATNYHILPIDEPKQTVISQISRHVYGDTIGFYLFQAFTALLLFLAANTSYNAFPRLAAVLAEDGFMPRQFAFRGDRLAYSTGIIILGLVAGTVVILGGGSTHALIPLYAVGVFIDFTIAQSGMVRHWLATRDPGWQRKLAVNAVGATLTAIIAVVVTSVKFVDGAWFVVVLIPSLVALMLFIRRQYDGQARELEVKDDLVFQRPHREQRVIIPVNGINRAVVQAVMFGKSLATDASMLQAVFVTSDLEEAERLRARWEKQLPGVPLVIVESPYRALVNPVVTYLDVLDHAWPPDKDAPTTIVVLPEYVARHWWDRLLYNQAAKRLKSALVGREHTVIADVPYRRSEQSAG